MPIKWTPEKDHALMFKIIDTHCPKIDVSKILEIWTEADGEKPTRRALIEHVAVLKKKAAGTPAKSPAKSPPKPVLTPTKPVILGRENKRHLADGSPMLYRKKAMYQQKDDSDVDMDVSDFGGLSAEDIIKREFPGDDRSVKSKVKNYAKLAGFETDDEFAADTGSDFAQADGAD